MAKHKTTIALDYDDTFTAYPSLFTDLIMTCKMYGIKITFVTYRDSRYDNLDILSDAEELEIDVVFTGGKQKEHLVDAAIWIDDLPENIVAFESLGLQYDHCLTIGDCNND